MKILIALILMLGLIVLAAGATWYAVKPDDEADTNPENKK